MTRKPKALKVVPFVITNDEAVEVARALLAKCESGEIVTFAAVGIEADNATLGYIGGGRKTKLEMMGAITTLLLHYWNGDIA